MSCRRTDGTTGAESVSGTDQCVIVSKHRKRLKPKPMQRFSLLFAALLAASAPVLGRDGPPQGDRDAAAERRAGLSPDQAAERVQRQAGGRVLAVQPAGGGYRVKVLTPQGEVRAFFVDESGGVRPGE